MYVCGWFCVAFEEELTGALTPVSIGDRRLMLARDEAGVRAFDARCPHRGANLAVGGHLVDGAVVCPYHGYRIRLGPCEGEWAVAELPALAVGGAVYVALNAAGGRGADEALTALSQTHDLVPGLTTPLAAPMEAVIENGFDWLHFRTIHRIGVTPFTVSRTHGGALRAQGRFKIPGRNGPTERSYSATAFGPGLIVVELGGPDPYGVITGSLPARGGGSQARLSFILPKGAVAAPGGRERHAELVAYSRQGLVDDNRIWSNLAPDLSPRWTPDDRPIEQFYAFCKEFEEPASSTR